MFKDKTLVAVINAVIATILPISNRLLTQKDITYHASTPAYVLPTIETEQRLTANLNFITR